MKNNMVLIIALLVTIAVLQGMIFIVYGFFISKSKAQLFMDLDEKRLRLNSYNSSILSSSPYISTVPFPFLAKYHIDGIGVVLRWSKLHYRINEYYLIALKKQLQTN